MAKGGKIIYPDLKINFLFSDFTSVSTTHNPMRPAEGIDLSAVPGTGNYCGLWLADSYDPSRLCQAIPEGVPREILKMISKLRWSKGCVNCPESLVPDGQRAQYQDLIFVRSGRSCNTYEAILPDTIVSELKEVFPLRSFQHEAALLIFLEENRYRTSCAMLVDCVHKFPASMLEEMLLIKTKHPDRWADEILFELAASCINMSGNA